MDKQLSKEETLSKITGEEGIYLTHGMIRGSDALEAMQEHSKQEAIAFTEWKDKNYISPHRDGNFIHVNIFFTKEHFSDETFYTTEQLYSLYQSK